MNWKLQVLIFSLLVTFPLIAVSNPFVLRIGLSSSIATLLQFSEDLYDKIFNKVYGRARDPLVAVQMLNDHIHSYFGETNHMLNNLPYIINHINNICFVFKNAVAKKLNIKENRREDPKTYENFRVQYESVIDKDIYEIYRMLLDNRTTSYLAASFRSNVHVSFVLWQ